MKSWGKHCVNGAIGNNSILLLNSSFLSFFFLIFLGQSMILCLLHNKYCYTKIFG